MLAAAPNRMPLAHSRTNATGHQSSRALSKKGRRPRIEGRHINIPVRELCCIWTSFQKARISPLDVRTWLAAREVAERRKFASRGREAAYKVSELAALVGKQSELKVRASLRRLNKAGLIGWSKAGPSFIVSTERLATPDASDVAAMLAMMPKRREFFPMPRRMLRLLAGGVKKSVLATVLGQLIWCVYHTKGQGWSGVGSVSAKTLASIFGMTTTSIENARAHLQKELRWLRPVQKPMWHVKRYGGSFEVNLAWNGQALQTVGEGQGSKLSTAVFGEVKPKNGAGFGELESYQPSSTKIYSSTPEVRQANPRPRDDSSKKIMEETKPTLRKVVKDDLRYIPRLMQLFEQAMSNPLWQSKGWTPVDTSPERLNWAAAARRALVRGGTNPCGLFLHLVSNRKWEHICNDDEQAVRANYSEWRDGASGGSYSRKRATCYGEEKLVPDGYLEGLVSIGTLSVITEAKERE